MSEDKFTIGIGTETYSFARAEIEELDSEAPLPEDIDDETPGL
jgi:hypothetical protein